MPRDMTPLALPKPAVPVFSAGELLLDVLERRQETQDIVTFVLRVERTDGTAFRHHPGQAIALTLPMPPHAQTRTFTIASPGREAGRIEITMKAAPDGFATKWAHETLAVGDRLTARGPFGGFSLVHHPKTPLLLIGGGSGLTPTMSMLRWLHRRRETADVVFVQAARRVQDLLFQQELDRIAAEMPSLKRFDVVAASAPGTSWNGYRGRIDRPMLRAMVPDLSQRTAFCCGPAGFMDTVGACFRAEGGAADRFLTESFGDPLEKIPAGPILKPSDSEQTAKWRGKTFAAPADQPLTVSAAAAGIRIPTGCREGVCGTCKVKLVSGDVAMNHQGGISAKEAAAGYVLACCSTPKTDLVLEG